VSFNTIPLYTADDTHVYLQIKRVRVLTPDYYKCGYIIISSIILKSKFYMNTLGTA